jgi:hypothetical protein
MATDQHQPASSQAIAPLATHRRDDYEHWSQFWRAIANDPTLTPARINDRITAFTNRTKAPTWSCLGIVKYPGFDAHLVLCDRVRSPI